MKKKASKDTKSKKPTLRIALRKSKKRGSYMLRSERKACMPKKSFIKEKKLPESKDVPTAQKLPESKDVPTAQKPALYSSLRTYERSTKTTNQVVNASTSAASKMMTNQVVNASTSAASKMMTNQVVNASTSAASKMMTNQVVNASTSAASKKMTNQVVNASISGAIKFLKNMDANIQYSNSTRLTIPTCHTVATSEGHVMFIDRSTSEKNIFSNPSDTCKKVTVTKNNQSFQSEPVCESESPDLQKTNTPMKSQVGYLKQKVSLQVSSSIKQKASHPVIEVEPGAAKQKDESHEGVGNEIQKKPPKEATRFDPVTESLQMTDSSHSPVSISAEPSSQLSKCKKALNRDAKSVNKPYSKLPREKLRNTSQKLKDQLMSKGRFSHRIAANKKQTTSADFSILTVKKPNSKRLNKKQPIPTKKSSLEKVNDRKMTKTGRLPTRISTRNKQHQTTGIKLPICSVKKANTNDVKGKSLTIEDVLPEFQHLRSEIQGFECRMKKELAQFFEIQKIVSNKGQHNIATQTEQFGQIGNILHPSNACSHQTQSSDETRVNEGPRLHNNSSNVSHHPHPSESNRSDNMHETNSFKTIQVPKESVNAPKVMKFIGVPSTTFRNSNLNAQSNQMSIVVPNKDVQYLFAVPHVSKENEPTQNLQGRSDIAEKAQKEEQDSNLSTVKDKQGVENASNSSGVLVTTVSDSVSENKSVPIPMYTGIPINTFPVAINLTNPPPSQNVFRNFIPVAVSTPYSNKTNQVLMLETKNQNELNNPHTTKNITLQIQNASEKCLPKFNTLEMPSTSKGISILSENKYHKKGFPVGESESEDSGQLLPHKIRRSECCTTWHPPKFNEISDSGQSSSGSTNLTSRKSRYSNFETPFITRSSISSTEKSHPQIQSGSSSGNDPKSEEINNSSTPFLTTTEKTKRKKKSRSCKIPKPRKPKITVEEITEYLDYIERFRPPFPNTSIAKLKLARRGITLDDIYEQIQRKEPGITLGNMPVRKRSVDK